MKNKKGFTLIELLAVIVILAIIALIAVPIILNMINQARKSAAKSAALGYIDAIEYNNGFAQIEQPGYTLVTGEDLNVTNINIKLKGKKPDSGVVTVNQNGQVSSATLCINGYTVVYNGQDITNVTKGCSSSSNNNQPSITFNGTKVKAGANDTHKGIIYIDPTDLNVTCDEEHAISTTGTKEGCMKFYIYDDSGSKYKMILDHNTSNSIRWNTTGNNADGISVAQEQLENDTENWKGNPRLIRADEIAKIVGIDSNQTIKWSKTKNYEENPSNIDTQVSWAYFDASGTTYSSSNGFHKAVASSSNKSNYAWLYDYTDCLSYGCNNSDSQGKYGYWTSDPVVGYSSRAWTVVKKGALGNSEINMSDDMGIRPVIELDKSIIN